MAACLFVQVSAWAQGTPRILRFEPAVIEIDTVRYDAGPVTVKFECVNICEKDVTILDVKSQCGCATATFGKGVIRPGGKGYVEVTLDPSHLFAEQNRHLTVVATNGDYRKFNTITVHGYVARDVTEEEVRYPADLGHGLRGDKSTVGMRLSERGETPVRGFKIYNATDKPMKLSWEGSSKRVGAEIPEILEPRTSAEVRVSVKTRRIPAGEYSEKLYIVVNGTGRTELLLKGAVK